MVAVRHELLAVSFKINFLRKNNLNALCTLKKQNVANNKIWLIKYYSDKALQCSLLVICLADNNDKQKVQSLTHSGGQKVILDPVLTQILVGMGFYPFLLIKHRIYLAIVSFMGWNFMDE